MDKVELYEEWNQCETFEEKKQFIIDLENNELVDDETFKLFDALYGEAQIDYEDEVLYKM